MGSNDKPNAYATAATVAGTDTGALQYGHEPNNILNDLRVDGIDCNHSDTQAW